MLIEIDGSRCISCTRYTQYYAIFSHRKGKDLQAIDCGYCAQLRRTTRPGNRCKHYQEKGNLGEPLFRLNSTIEVGEGQR